MKRSSAILLWISLVWSFVGMLFGIFSAVLIYQLLHPAAFVVPSASRVRLHQGTDSIEVMRDLDFAGGAVIHISPNIVCALIPIAAWLVVWLTDREAVKMPLGRLATWTGVAYLFLVIVALVWLESLVTAS